MRRIVGWVSVVVVAVSAVAAPDPARLVFLLRYVGSDYAGAVRDGTVVDAFEYGEVLRFTREIVEGYAAQSTKEDGVATDLAALERAIVARAPASIVRERTRALVPALAAALGVPASGPGTGDAARGATVFRDTCARCHGPRGAGDGSDAATLDPRPPSLADPAAAGWSLEQIFGAVTYGVDGTAMASFGDVLDEQQRWNVAAFVASLGRAAAPASEASAEDPGLTVALRLESAFARVAVGAQPSVMGVTSFVDDPGWNLERLAADRGPAWIAAHAEELQFPGFRPLTAGSGFLASDDGYVLTAAHLLRDAEGRTVPLVGLEFRDGRHVKARVVGVEPTIDLGVLRLVELADPKERNVAALPFGDSDTVEVGSWVIAAGDPPGADVTYAVGTLAARPERECYQEDLTRTLFQTSIDVAPGSQGGPLLDVRGRVIGLSVRRPPGGDATEGGSSRYALPINLVRTIYEALTVAESDRSPWLGVSVLELASARRRLGSRAPEVAFPRTGVYIDDVFDPSPAFAAGIRPGDFLVALGPHRVLSVADFQKWLYLGGIGNEVEVELFRGGKAQKYRLRIEARPPEATTR